MSKKFENSTCKGIMGRKQARHPAKIRLWPHAGRVLSCKPSLWSCQQTDHGHLLSYVENHFHQHAVSSPRLLESGPPFQIPGLCNGFWAPQTELETATDASGKTACWSSLESHLLPEHWVVTQPLWSSVAITVFDRAIPSCSSVTSSVPHTTVVF